MTVAGIGAGVAASAGILLAVVVCAFAMIPYGGTPPWASSTIACASLLVGAMACLGLAFGGRSYERLHKVRWPILAFALAGLFAFVQAISLPVGLVSFLSPWVGEAWRAAGDAASAGALSLDKFGARAYGLQLFGYLSLTVVALVSAGTPGRVKLLAWSLLGIGAGQAVFGLWTRFTGYDFVPRLLRDGHFEIASGTFINRNHFGELLVMASCVAIGLILARAGRGVGGYGLRGFAARAIDFLLDVRGLLAAILTVLVAAIFFSGSRGAILSLVGALVLLFAWLRVVGKDRGNWHYAPFVLVGALAVAALWLGFGTLGERFGSLASIDATRIRTWELTAAIFRSSWLAGTGAGSFALVFPLWRDGSLPPLAIEHAHNDYLELLSESGILGFALVGGALVLVAARLLRTLRSRRDPLVRGMVFASLSGMLAMLIHSLVEFNFRIPALGSYFFLLMGLGLAAASLPSAGQGRRRRGIVIGDDPDSMQSTTSAINTHE